ncbi:Chaperone protein dnaJ 13 [Acorus calamus]|uniref:Chaperone protein dnaJ 13 n=1 Tax=Acorus calamus TaxID=4465 RepID=A0AAV9C7W6_ACOCL|nr:Chaperone protein dnaJ 13 [Acorus calamus]
MWTYYWVLQLSKNANQQEINKAYQKMISIWHPSKNPRNPIAQSRFNLINQAYKVLCDPVERARYDKFGDPAFTENHGLKKQPAVETPLRCTLEELYVGKTKNLRITRSIVAFDGTKNTEQEILEIRIQPGWKRGVRITFPEKGDVLPNSIPADIVFIIEEIPHNIFKKEGNDLVVTRRISLIKALTGFALHLTTLDGRNLAVPVSEIINPDYEKVIPNEGMPIAKSPGMKGNLRINFIIEFPTGLSTQDRTDLKELLSY